MASRTLPTFSRAPSRFAPTGSRASFAPIRPSARTPPSRAFRRCSSSSPDTVQAPDHLDANERRVFEMVKQGLQPTKLEVQDISGGCGSMYALDIVSERFTGLPVIKQHRLVNQILGDEIKQWHGVQLKTKAP